MPEQQSRGEKTIVCPLPHRDGRGCWLCGSFYRSWVTAWVLEQWVKAGKPRTRPL